MYTQAALLDIHARTHRSLQMVIDHCATLPVDDLLRAVEGFSYPTLASQLHHLIGAERYWLGVLRGEILLDDDADAHQTIEALSGLRVAVEAATAGYLRGASDTELSSPRTVTKWNGDTVDLVPAHVLLRTQTHVFQHHGELASMIRLLGHQFPSGLDFPLTDAQTA